MGACKQKIRAMSFEGALESTHTPLGLALDTASLRGVPNGLTILEDN
jgi:hypothetical protein